MLFSQPLFGVESGSDLVAIYADDYHTPKHLKVSHKLGRHSHYQQQITTNMI